jgi:hypothetical protein
MRALLFLHFTLYFTLHNLHNNNNNNNNKANASTSAESVASAETSLLHSEEEERRGRQKQGRCATGAWQSNRTEGRRRQARL